jgi:hypothetical protein
MHLDCVFSILGDDCCLMLDEMMGPESPSRRLVDEWTRSAADGRYECTRRDVEFSEFMREEGYHIIPIAAADQLVRRRGRSFSSPAPWDKAWSLPDVCEGVLACCEGESLAERHVWQPCCWSSCKALSWLVHATQAKAV